MVSDVVVQGFSSGQNVKFSLEERLFYSQLRTVSDNTVFQQTAVSPSCCLPQFATGRVLPATAFQSHCSKTDVGRGRHRAALAFLGESAIGIKCPSFLL